MQFVHYTCLSDSVPRYLSAHLPLAIFDLPIISMEWVEFTSYESCEIFDDSKKCWSDRTLLA